jgi:hypothetical protein
VWGGCTWEKQRKQERERPAGARLLLVISARGKKSGLTFMRDQTLTYPQLTTSRSTSTSKQFDASNKIESGERSGSPEHQ